MGIDSVLDLINPETLIREGGLEIILFIVFLETAVFFCFFLPGDSLLFITGVLCSSEVLPPNVFIVCFLITLAAVCGSSTGYFIGTKAVRFFTNKPEGLFYRKRYIEDTQSFFIRYGMWIFILGRFIPGIRTFLPLVAGMVKISIKKFMLYNVIGSIAWVSTMVLAGFGLGHAFPQLTERLELVVAGIIALTMIPILYRWVKARRKVNR